MDYKRHQRLSYKVSNQYPTNRQLLMILFLPLALFGEMKVMLEPWSIWSTSPARSLASLSGMDSSLACTSPM